MFTIFFVKELKMALKQPMVYIFLLLITLLTFGATISDNIIIGGAVGNVYKNAPHIITVYTSILSIFGLFIATAFFNNAALRDYSNNFNEILFSTPLSKSGYYFGRFFGALLLSTIPLLGVFIGVVIGSTLAPVFNWVDADRFGSYQLLTFINNYFIFILPNMFFAGAIIFGLANKWQSTIISFVGSLIIVIGYIISLSLISDVDNETIGALIDTFGIRTYTIQAKYYTPIEKNNLNPSFTGLLLFNRAIWTTLGIVILILSYFSFSFQKKNKKLKIKKNEKSNVIKTFKLPQLNPAYTTNTTWSHFKSFFVISVLSIIKNVTFKILFLFSFIILLTALFAGFDYYGLQTYPLTYKIIDTIKSDPSLFVIIILVFFSGELVWRDRDFKINEVIDATPHSSIISLAAKALSLVLIATTLRMFFIFCGILFQVFKGYYRIEIGTYLLDFIYTDLVTYVVWSGIMILIQVVLKNKYIGYFVSILVIFVWSIVLFILNIESNMLSINGTPSMVFSDMNSFGPSLPGVLWFNTYWLLFSFICLLIAGLLWNRGSHELWNTKILQLKKQLPKAYKYMLLTVVSCWTAVAGFIYYNTQILNKYNTSDEQEKLTVAYEKAFKKFENVPLPKIKEINYFIDIFPYKRNVHAKADITFINESNTAIDSIHFSIDPNWQPEFLIPNAKLVFKDDRLNYQIYKLETPLQPKQELKAVINTKYITKGFKNDNYNTNIVKNGTFLNNFEIFPALGYQNRIELTDKNLRKKHDLKPKDRMPKLESNCGSACMDNYLSLGSSDYIKSETVISTSSDQVAIAPGTLVKKWNKDDRTYFHYKTDHPSLNFFAFVSAKYTIKKRQWNGKTIEVYYDPKHPQNIEMMFDAVERSLDYYTKNFGPYTHQQCRIIEFPRYRSFAQAFPGTMPYSESVGFVIDLENEEDNNIVDQVIAHEMAHQWWAHQVIGAQMQGSTMFSESFSEYSSLMTMKHISKTPMKMREFLKYNHDRYLRGRSSELDIEMPLYKVENQQYIHYGKGSIQLYALQDYIGEDNVNSAMRNFLEEFKYKKPPYPTSLDFMKHLEPKVPDSLKYLVDDLFKTITLYDNRMKEAKYKKLSNGKYEITMNIESKKISADSIGGEKPLKVNDWIDLGAFADSDEKKLIFEKRVKINQPEMEFTFEIDTIPAKLAIDPRRLLIDRVYKDNSKSAVELDI